MRRVSLYITGRVQGVFYRRSAQKKANELGVTGWVKNLEDGNVEAVAEGRNEAVDEFISWSKQGPLMADVKEVTVRDSEYKREWDDFKVL